MNYELRMKNEGKIQNSEFGIQRRRRGEERGIKNEGKFRIQGDGG